MKTDVPKRFLGSKTAQLVLFVLTLIYCISPIDLIPDVLPVIGWLDDVGMLVLDLIAFLKYLQYRREESRKDPATPKNS